MTELFAIINNSHESILKLNDLLSKKGFEFIKIGIPDLEKKFKFIFGLPKKYTNTGTIRYPNGIVTDTFFNFVSSSELIDDWQTEYIIALKTNIGSIELDENDDFGFKRFEFITKFTDDLIDKLRLCKEGDIEAGCYFSFDQDTGKGQLLQIKRALYTGIGIDYIDNEPIQLINDFLELSDNDVIEFNNNFLDLNISNALAAKAKMYFDQSYKIQRVEIRYILLVTALESILTLSDQRKITHRLSKRLSFILSDNKEDYNLKYERVKTLYGYRSEIVHGRNYNKEELQGNCKELREYVRKCILYVNQLNVNDNKDLIELLNTKGY